MNRVGAALRLSVTAPAGGSLPYHPRRIERSARTHVSRTIRHAARHVPFYRAALAERGLDPGSLRTAADLARLPLIGRHDLQEDPARFLSAAEPLDELIEMRTGGTSGRPISVYRDPATLFAAAAHQERRRRPLLRAAGRRLRLRQMTFAGSHSTRGITAREFSRRSLVPRGIRVADRSHSMFDPLERQVARIESFRPDVIAGYGSYLEMLFAHIEARGGVAHLPAALTYSGDAISRQGRERLQTRWGFEIFSSYSAVEAFHIGFECERHTGFHINTDIYPVRLVDRDGHAVPDGTSGEVVISNLVSRGTVLLNYRLGDRAHWIGEPCPCGRSLPLLSFIEGRLDDWLETADGRPLHPQGLRELFTTEGALVRAYQVEQRARDSYLLRVVLAPDVTEADRAALERRLERGMAAVSGATETSIAYVERIPRTPQGKLRTVIAAPNGAPEIGPASASDRDQIMAVMSSANMNHPDSPEMPAIDLDRFFVARLDGRIVGAAGWEMPEPHLGKTTLLAVLPEAQGRGAGLLLQRARMDAMRRAGADRVRTNADRPETIRWYCTHFGYRRVGELAKLDEFGDPEIDRWTTLEAPLTPPAGLSGRESGEGAEHSG